MKANLLLINVDELWLKGGNRPRYFSTLKSHLKAIFKLMHDSGVDIKNENQRFVATSKTNFSMDVIHQLQKVPGLHSIIPAMKVASELEEITKCAVEQMAHYKDQHITFRVNTKRVNKFFEKSSMETSGYVGHFLLQEYPTFKVLLKNSQVIVDVKIQNDFSYVSHQKFMAMGGLPVSTSGHVVTLLSGGFDSPVASYLMSKRGCSQDYAFFYAYPYVGEEVKEKILEIAKVLASYQNGSVLYVIPFGNIQQAIADKCRPSYRTLLFRKYMVQTATELAKKVGAKALITGDCLGQVSSQTLDNLSAIESIATIPILRPVIGMNKREIINIAEFIGTHDVSVIPHDDACSLFAPDAPVLRPDLIYWKSFDSQNDFTQLIDEAINGAEKFKFSALGKIL